MEPIITPIQLLTIRAHLLGNRTVIAAYAVGNGKSFKTGHKVYKEVGRKNLKGIKLDILNQALMALGENKKVEIEVEEKFILDFITDNKLKNEPYYQDTVDNLRTNLSLCSSVSCKSWINRNLFNAALDEYKQVKKTVFPDPTPTYKELFAQQKKLREARQYEKAISTW